MHDLASINDWAQMAGALVVVGLGLFLLLLRRRSAAGTALGWFASCFGLLFVCTNTGFLFFDVPKVPPIDGPLAYEVARGILSLAVMAVLLVLAARFPSPLGAGERRYLAFPLASAALALAIFVYERDDVAGRLAAMVSYGTMYVTVGLLTGIPVMLACRAARATDAGKARQFALVAAAMTMYTGFIATAGFNGSGIFSVLDKGAIFDAPFLAANAMACILWIRASAVGPDTRGARNVALLGQAMALLGLLYVAFHLQWGALGIVRTSMVAILVYGIARHQLLGLDLKVRFAIKTSTVAAVFLGVLFIVANIAQNYFGGQYGVVVGGAAAGLLFFAITPIQRMAERLSEKAVPLAAEVAPAPAGPATFYRKQAELAWMDGAMTRREGLMLEHLRQHLGLTEAEATRIETDIMGKAPKPRP